MKVGDKVQWTYPETGRSEVGVVTNLEPKGDNVQLIYIKTSNDGPRYICDLDAGYLGLEVLNESR